MSLKITEIEYSELKTGSGYDNKKVGIKCSVGANEDPNEVLKKAKEYVQDKVNNFDEKITEKRKWIEELQKEINSLKEQKRNIENELESINDYKRLRLSIPAIIKLSNFINNTLNDDIPPF